MTEKEKAIQYDLDQAGIDSRARDLVELVELRARVLELQALLEAQRTATYQAVEREHNAKAQLAAAVAREARVMTILDEAIERCTRLAGQAHECMDEVGARVHRYGAHVVSNVKQKAALTERGGEGET